MKTVTIDSKFVRRELLILLGCFIAAVVFDLVGIIMYSRPLAELISTIGYEITICAGLYIFTAFIRIVIFLVSGLFHRER